MSGHAVMREASGFDHFLVVKARAFGPVDDEFVRVCGIGRGCEFVGEAFAKSGGPLEFPFAGIDLLIHKKLDGGLIAKFGGVLKSGGSGGSGWGLGSQGRWVVGLVLLSWRRSRWLHFGIVFQELARLCECLFQIFDLHWQAARCNAKECLKPFDTLWIPWHLIYFFVFFGLLFGQATIVVVASPRKPWEVCLDSFYNRHLFIYLYTTFL